MPLDSGVSRDWEFEVGCVCRCSCSHRIYAARTMTYGLGLDDVHTVHDQEARRMSILVGVWSTDIIQHW